MTLDILICTIDEGIERVPEVLMSPRGDVRYVVSMQYSCPCAGRKSHAEERGKELETELLKRVPQVLREREDVVLTFLEGRGLSRNRNHALEMATGDILLIADDDNRYTKELIDRIFEAYREHEKADIICFAAESYGGEPMKTYPTETMPYRRAMEQGYYPTSMEMTMRKGVEVRFDERFGLGSELLCAGEEDVFLKDAQDKGYQVLFVPKVIVRSRYETTGSHFIGNKKLQMSKGATFKYVYGTPNALWRTLKEAGWWLVHRKVNPVPILWNMLKGMVEV